jgi:drug/metabolite transporter (DMT)-like permease
MVCFAANSVITRYLVLVSQVSPFLVTTLRFVSGLAMLLVLPSFRPSAFHHDKPSPSYLPGAFFLGAYAFSISYGYVFISVAAGTFVFYTFVVVTMSTYSVVHDREPLTLRLILGEIFGLGGVLVITFGRISSVSLAGVILMAVTGASWGLYSAYGKRFETAFSYTYNSFLVLGSFAILSSIILILSGQPLFSHVSIANLGLALYMGTISTALSYVLWNATVKQITASVGGLVQLIVPVLAPAMGIIFLGEKLTAPLILGGGMVLLAIYTVSSKPHAKN